MPSKDVVGLRNIVEGLPVAPRCTPVIITQPTIFVTSRRQEESSWTVPYYRVTGPCCTTVYRKASHTGRIEKVEDKIEAAEGT